MGEVKRLAYEMQAAQICSDYWGDENLVVEGPAEFPQAEKEKNRQYWWGVYKKYRQRLALRVLESVMAGCTGEQVREAILAGRERAIDEMED